MRQISIVIITYNESLNIEDCIRSAGFITRDIVVVDAGSTDDTCNLAAKAGARVKQVQWRGYGHSRNVGAGLAVNDWIFSLDADERLTPGLAREIETLDFSDPAIIYGFGRKNFFTGRAIDHGSWGRDKVYRLYHRNATSWDSSLVHEQLLPGSCTRMLLSARIVHFPAREKTFFHQKLNRYASLAAQKYYLQNKSSPLLKRCLSPVFVFLHSYIFLLGFLDGKAGYGVAQEMAWYTWLKYDNLARLQKGRAWKVDKELIAVSSPNNDPCLSL